MKTYFVRTPKIVSKIFSKYTWSLPLKNKVVYLTFDDGPTEYLTTFILDVLKTHQVKATFFCVGENILKYPKLVSAIKDNGHSIGNHTFNHLNGLKTKFEVYINNTLAFEKRTGVESKLFRPPYGKLTKKQAKRLISKGYRIVMWTILSGDFDFNLSNEDCLKNVTRNIKNGDIIVFHDNIKAKEKLEFVLDKMIIDIKNKGFRFELIQ
jgi:peptidoglycan/xylan/chitin deacetylase (PgdA/CDA1 family)